MKSTSKILILSLIIAFSGISLLTAQNRIELLEEESKVWIEGSSTVNDIFCKAGQVVGYANIQQVDLHDEENHVPDNLLEESENSITINIPVWEFDCGRRQMNRDFYRALKADDYPSIEFRYHAAKLITNLDPECHPFQLEVEGVLSVAGVGKDVTIMVDIEPCEENRFRLTGSKKINMRDFDIDPPSALFGLIRAHEELEVFFSLTAVQKN